MATLRRFEDIEAWQKVRELTRAVYSCSKSGAFARDFGLRDQIRRAAVSVMSNIAEGFERGGTLEFVQFLAIAKGSTGEVESQLYVALDQEYIGDGEFRALKATAVSTKRLIAGLMNYLRRSGIKGGEVQTVLSSRPCFGRFLVAHSDQECYRPNTGTRTRNHKLEKLTRNHKPETTN